MAGKKKKKKTGGATPSSPKKKKEGSLSPTKKKQQQHQSGKKKKKNHLKGSRSKTSIKSRSATSLGGVVTEAERARLLDARVDRLQAFAASLRAEYSFLQTELRETKELEEATRAEGERAVESATKQAERAVRERCELDERVKKTREFHEAAHKKIETEFARKQLELRARKESLETELERCAHVVEERDALIAKIDHRKDELQALLAAQAAEMRLMEDAKSLEEHRAVARLCRAGELDAAEKAQIHRDTHEQYETMERQHDELSAKIRAQGRQIADLVEENTRLVKLRTEKHLDYANLLEMNERCHRKLAKLTQKHQQQLQQVKSDDQDTVVTGCSPSIVHARSDRQAQHTIPTSPLRHPKKKPTTQMSSAPGDKTRRPPGSVRRPRPPGGRDTSTASPRGRRRQQQSPLKSRRLTEPSLEDDQQPGGDDDDPVHPPGEPPPNVAHSTPAADDTTQSAATDDDYYEEDHLDGPPKFGAVSAELNAHLSLRARNLRGAIRTLHFNTRLAEVINSQPIVSNDDIPPGCGECQVLVKSLS